MRDFLVAIFLLCCIGGVVYGGTERRRIDLADAKRAAHLIFLQHKTPVTENCRANIKFIFIKQIKHYYVFIVEPDMKKCVTDRAWFVIAKDGLEYRMVTLGTAFSGEKDPVMRQIFEGM